MNLSSWPGPFPTAVEQNASDKAGSFEELKHSRHLLLFRTLLHRPGPPPTSENDLSQPARGQTKSIIHYGRVLDFRSSSKRELGVRSVAERRIGLLVPPLRNARNRFRKYAFYRRPMVPFVLLWMQAGIRFLWSESSEEWWEQFDCQINSAKPLRGSFKFAAFQPRSDVCFNYALSNCFQCFWNSGIGRWKTNMNVVKRPFTLWKFRTWNCNAVRSEPIWGS